ncbi:hypothetical protein MXB_2245 [Myxobolus squamalis]|nr:hypothetical protein MXB_2245 [Myxobolus squamalis]
MPVHTRSGTLISLVSG